MHCRKCNKEIFRGNPWIDKPMPEQAYWNHDNWPQKSGPYCESCFNIKEPKPVKDEVALLKQDRYVAIEAILGAISLLSWIEVGEPMNKIKNQRIQELRMTLEAIGDNEPEHNVQKFLPSLAG